MRLVPERNDQSSNDPAIIEVDSTLLRDYFAGQAIQLFSLESEETRLLQFHKSIAPAHDLVAAFCYDLADAMMKERIARGI